MLKLDKTGSIPQLYLYGIIAKPSWWTDGEEVSAAGVLELLDQIDPGAELIVRINSEGGDVFEGVAIYNALSARQARVETHVDALAASIASVIAMAGDEIVVAGNAMLMIHQAWTIAAGNATEMAKVAETLTAIDKTIIDTYEARVGGKSTRAQIEDWVKAETWMGAGEAVERGFATRAGDLKSGVEASVRPGMYRNTPKSLLRTQDRQSDCRDRERSRERRPEDREREPVSRLAAIAAKIRIARL